MRSDPEVRRRDYLAGISWYAAKLPPETWTITLVENSDSDVSFLVHRAAALGHDLRIVRSASNPAGRTGKGNGEARMIDDAIHVLQAEAEDSLQVVKATGRLIVRNLEAAVPHPPVPHISTRMHRDRSMADTRLLAADLGTWKRFLTGLDALVNEEHDRFLEHAVALRTAEALFHGSAIWVPFRSEIAVAGTSGTDGIRYDTTRARFTRIVKDVLGRVPQGEYR